MKLRGNFCQDRIGIRRKTECSAGRSVDRFQFDHCKSLPACCIGKTVIERNHFADAPRLGKPLPVAVHRQHAAGEHEEIVSLLPRIASLGSISCQASASCCSRRSASVIARALSAPSRSRRAKAELHSTSDPHHTSMAESFATIDSSCRVCGSTTSSGTIAEASQNFTDPRAVPR